jgi:hypothetical protein
MGRIGEKLPLEAGSRVTLAAMIEGVDLLAKKLQ